MKARSRRLRPIDDTVYPTGGWDIERRAIDHRGRDDVDACTTRSRSTLSNRSIAPVASVDVERRDGTRGRRDATGDPGPARARRSTARTRSRTRAPGSRRALGDGIARRCASLDASRAAPRVGIEGESTAGWARRVRRIDHVYARCARLGARHGGSFGVRGRWELSDRQRERKGGTTRWGARERDARARVGHGASTARDLRERDVPVDR